MLSPKGRFFTASSGPGTFVAQQAQITAFSDTGPLFVINNRDQPNIGRKIQLAYLKLMLGGTAPTATVSLECAVRIDTLGKTPTNANQYTNPVPVNVDSSDSEPSIATLYAYVAAQAMVTPASSGNVRQVATLRVPTSLGIVGDEYAFQFAGGLDSDVRLMASNNGLTAARSTAVVQIATHGPAVVIAPGAWATVHLWWLTSATNLPTWQWEWGWWEL